MLILRISKKFCGEDKTDKQCLFLQGMYNLSDLEVEDQLRDRMSFQKFVGVSTGASDICKFLRQLFRCSTSYVTIRLTPLLKVSSNFTINQMFLHSQSIAAFHICENPSFMKM